MSFEESDRKMLQEVHAKLYPAAGSTPEVPPSNPVVGTPYPSHGSVTFPSPNSAKVGGELSLVELVIPEAGKYLWQITANGNSNNNAVTEAWLSKTPDGGTMEGAGTYAKGSAFSTIGNTAELPVGVTYLRTKSSEMTSLTVSISKQ